uniref:tyrosine-type recombinase/integrase n=1 Tax=Ectopseudomonas guguanensis TaxID=1198456 RepID=UPI0035E45CD3
MARTTIRLPKGQAAHALRHTFASHFIQNGGDILTLQKILGHSSPAMTMRYAHLAPEHLAEAVKLNPIAGITDQLGVRSC